MAQVSAHIGSDDAVAQLRSLAGWLRNEDEFRGRVELELAERTVQPGQMGGILDSLTVAVGSGGVAGTLVQSLFLWLRQRRSGPSVRLKLKSSDGREAELDLQGMQDPEIAIDKVVGFFGQSE